MVLQGGVPVAPHAPARVADLAEQVTGVWDGAVASWSDRPDVVLFDEAAKVLTTGVRRWAGVPLDGPAAEPVARDLVATVDGFATPGPRHWRARSARGRCETWLARLEYDVPPQDLTIPLCRVPTRPRSGFRSTSYAAPMRETGPHRGRPAHGGGGCGARPPDSGRGTRRGPVPRVGIASSPRYAPARPPVTAATVSVSPPRSVAARTASS